MRYSRRPKSLLALAGVPAVVVGLLIVLVLLARFVFPGALQAVAEPFWTLGSAAARVVVGEDVATLREERDELKAQVDTLLAEKLTLELSLRDVAKFTEDDTRTAARVFARPPITPYDMLVIGAGSKDGVREGQGVYGPGGTPLGTVASVGASRAQVSLYSASLRESQAIIGDESVPVTLVGRGSGAFYAAVATDAPVKENDVVSIEGLPVGIIARVDKDPSSPEATLIIRPIANPFTLSWVQVATELP